MHSELCYYRLTIAADTHDLSAGQWKNQLQAEKLLARMALLEDVALLAEQGPVWASQKRFAEKYRTLVGVGPEHREAFRAGLERIRAEGGMATDDLAQLINRDSREERQ